MGNSGIFIHKKDVDDHNVTVANPQHGSIGGFKQFVSLTRRKSCADLACGPLFPGTCYVAEHAWCLDICHN